MLINMRGRDLLLLITAAANARILKKRSPLFVNWAITNKCNARCQYCRIWSNEVEELDTPQVYSLIDELKRRGAMVINFTGGEPLIRDDFGSILDYIYKKRIYSVVNTNGMLVPQKISNLEKAAAIKLSLDAPSKTHDFLRGQGSFQATIKAIEIAKNRSLRIFLCTVLSEQNIDYVDYIVDFAKHNDTPVVFQPITQTLLGSKEHNPFLPCVRRYREAVRKLIDLKNKSQTRKYICNSMAVLKHMYSWPKPKKMRCGGGLIFCHINAGGNLSSCARSGNVKVMKRVDLEFQEAFKSLSSYSCNSCWCPGLLELNFLFSFNLDSMINMVTMNN